ncbi:hypothetical protein AB8880_02095 [Alphaproteobacteria bacterium LSUCC0684]
MAKDPLQAVAGIAAQCPGFAETLRIGRFHLRTENKRHGKLLAGAALLAPLECRDLHLVPVVAGSARGRGKAVLGLTLLGLSFIPGANGFMGSAFGQVGQSLISPQAGTAFQHFGSALLGRAGGLLMLSGAAEMLSPQASSPAGVLPSAAISVPDVSGQGAPIPLVYGNARLTRPVVISSGLSVITE